MLWFTSDTHFNHVNIIKYCDRPFGSVKHMNEVMIERWNRRVADDDEVWFLGDFALGDRREHKALLRGLNGQKHLIHGNHDNEDMRKDEEWRSSQGTKILKTPIGRLHLYHYPIWEWDRDCVAHLHGHTHDTRVVTARADETRPSTSYSVRINVGVDAHNFSPVSLDCISERIRNT